MKVLGIESSCDETAAAVVEDGRRVLSNIISSQLDLHVRFGGVVPEIACRAHLLRVNGCVQEAMDSASVGWGDIDAIAVTNRPGLVGSVLIGLCAAKAYALAHAKPLVGVHHIVGHIYAAFLTDPPAFPFVALVASGGHSDLILVRGHGDFERLGATRDDAAGEAFDKVARLLGLPHPGGPNIDRVAAAYDGPGRRFPRADMGESLDYSFSGLKTAVARHVEGYEGDLTESEIGHVSKGFQDAVVDALMTNLVRAVQQHGARTIVIGGGVAANSQLRSAVLTAGERHGFDAVIPPMVLCTDNAAMIATVGCFELDAGRTHGLDLDAFASSPLP